MHGSERDRGSPFPTCARIWRRCAQVRRCTARFRPLFLARHAALSPLSLGALRRKMVGLAAELAQGAVWANAARSHMSASLAVISPERRGEKFFVGNMIPTSLDADSALPAADTRKT